MGKPKKRDASDSDSDSGPDDRRAPPAKKVAKANHSGNEPNAPGNPNEPKWHIGNNKWVTVREFKGKTYVDIREFYVDKNTMDTKPGKKGISLNTEQYQKLKGLIDDIDHALP